MPGALQNSSRNYSGLVHSCIRDLAALNALPSMCVGRSPDEVIDVALEALLTALSCDLVYLTLPGSPPRERAALRGARLPEAALAELRAVLADAANVTSAVA